MRSAVSRTPVKGVGLPMGLPAYFGDARAQGVLLPQASAGCCWLALLLLLLSSTLGHMGEMGGPAEMKNWDTKTVSQLNVYKAFTRLTLLCTQKDTIAAGTS